MVLFCLRRTPVTSTTWLPSSLRRLANRLCQTKTLMMISSKSRIGIVVMIALALLTACADPEPVVQAPTQLPTPTPTVTPTPSAVDASPTPDAALATPVSASVAEVVSPVRAVPIDSTTTPTATPTPSAVDASPTPDAALATPVSASVAEVVSPVRAVPIDSTTTPTAMPSPTPVRQTPTPTSSPTPEPVLTILADYHPKLREAILHPAPDTAGDKAFLADGELSESELRALERAQSVFGIPAFYNAWELDTLEANEVQAALYMLSFYDPYTVVNDITADPADPEAEGARMTRALDDFGVYPGSCVYCKGQNYPRKEWRNWNSNPTFHRTKLLNLVHHATVQADMLSPCDLNDFSEEELLALGVMEPNYVGARLLYGGGMLSFTHSVRLTNELLDSASEGAAAHGVSDERIANAPGVLVQPGEILSPFTHAIRATGGPPTARGMELCLKAVEGIVDWDRKRYDHFGGHWVDTMSPYIEYIFPENPYVPPVWATFLVYESGGQDKGERLAAQFRALNMPAVKDLAGIRLNENAERFVISSGRYGVFLPAFSLYIHRNIGFSETEKEADIKKVVQNITIPNHCALQRGRGSFQYGTAFVEYVCVKKARSFDDPPEGPFATISAGTEHVCALMTDGTPVCWGSESDGKSSPPAGAKFTTISAGSNHTCALMADGTPVCWGNDIDGQSSPPAGEKFTDISAGFSYTCALRQDGTPSCWGYDIFRRSSNPKEVKELFYSSRFREIDTGEIYDACGLLADGGMLCNTGRSFQIEQDVHSISSGIHARCALRRDGSPLCWGPDDFTPPAGEKFTDISVGSGSLACGLRTDGTAVCWGQWASVSPSAGAKFIDISVLSARRADGGYGYVCALSENGAAACWRH